MYDQITKQIVNLIERSQKIIVMPSSPPDGDSIGSSLAFYEVLKKLNKEVTVVCADNLPDVLRFLPQNEVILNKFNPSQDFIVTLDCSQKQIENVKYNVEKDKVNIIVTPEANTFSPKDVSFHYGPTKYDLIITVDTATLGQLGVLYEGNADFFYNTPLVNIDHHASNEYYGTINLVDVTAASTTEILLNVFENLQKDEPLIDEDIATLLLAGIITDTGSFQNANTTPKSLAVSARLLKMGARQQEIIKNVYKTKELSTLKLWGSVLSRLKYDKKYKIVWSVISLHDFQETGSRSEDTGGIIDELMSNAPGAEIILLMKEKEEGLISCSLRTSSAAINASELAEKFNGGGHPQAAGFRIKNKSLDEAQDEVLSYFRKVQSQRHNIDQAGEIEEVDTEKVKSNFEKSLQSEVLDNTEDEIIADDSADTSTEKKEIEGKADNHNESKVESEESSKDKPKNLENPLTEIIGNADDEKSDESDYKDIFYKFGE